jgi:hypothetical protein
MKFIRQIPVIMALLVLVACEAGTTWDLETSGRFPVADCILTNEMRNQELTLHWSVPALNIPTEGIEGATVSISDGENEIPFEEDPDTPGLYRSQEAFTAVAGIRYRLTVALDGYADTAWAEMTGVEPLDEPDVVPSDSLFRLAYHNSHNASMTEVEYDWSAVPEYALIYGASKAGEVFYTLDNIDPGKEFAPERKKILFPAHTVITRRCYALNTEHQAFIRALLLETDWRGGFFDAEPGNVPTNFSHGVRGWFAACSVVSDTFIVE